MANKSSQALEYRFPEPIIEVVVNDSARTQPWAETARTFPPTKTIEADYELRGSDTYETLIREAVNAL